MKSKGGSNNNPTEKILFGDWVFTVQVVFLPPSFLDFKITDDVGDDGWTTMTEFPNA